jgi:hypothetical protein
LTMSDSNFILRSIFLFHNFSFILPTAGPL